jgi:hypothetical protein
VRDDRSIPSAFGQVVFYHFDVGRASRVLSVGRLDRQLEASGFGDGQQV